MPHSNHNLVRIQAGRYRGSVLYLGEAGRQVHKTALRPSPARLRETLFNWLGQNLDGLECLDLFAGSGVLGIEAASRGAEKVVLVEADHEAAQSIARNITRINLQECTLWQGRVEAYLSRLTAPFDVVFCDPPYQIAAQVAQNFPLRQAVLEGGWLYFESGNEISVITGFERVKYCQVGQAHGHLFLATSFEV